MFYVKKILKEKSKKEFNLSPLEYKNKLILKSKTEKN
jgi:hypothetical protein